MKKSFSLILLSCFIALPAFAQAATQTTGQTTSQASGQITTQTINQTSQSTKAATTKTAEPVQVNVTINNSASAQGNTQTTTIDNQQSQSTTAAANQKESSGATVTGSASVHGDYSGSYQSNPKIEALRNSAWQALVPRKKLYNDPAGRNAGRVYSATTATSKSQTTQTSKTKSSKTKSGTAQASKAKSGTTAGINSITTQTNTSTSQANMANSQTNGTQNLNNGLQNLNLEELKQKLASGQMIILEPKDGEICFPIEQFAQLTGQMAVQGQMPVQGTGQTEPAASAASGTSGLNSGSPVLYSPLFENSASGTNGEMPVNSANGNGAAPASPFIQTSPAASANPVNPVSSASNASANTANAANPTPQAPLRTVTPLGGDAENDIFAIPSNPFESANSASPASSVSPVNPVNPASPANPAITGNSNPLADNPMARGPLAGQVQRDNQRDISITQNTAGTQTVTTTTQTTAAAQTNP